MDIKEKKISTKMQRQLSVIRRYAGMHKENQTKIELRFRCSKVIGKDSNAKANAMAVVSTEQDGKWIEICRTETITNSSDPAFSKCIKIDYNFEETQNVKFRIYDTSTSMPEPSESHFLGGMTCSLGQMVAASPFTKRLLFDNGAFAGISSITIFVEEQAENKEHFEFKFSAKGIDNKDLLSISDPYLEMHKRLPNESWELLHRTEVKKNTLNPTWDAFKVAKQTLLNNNYSEEIKLLVWDHDNKGTPDFIGEVLIDFNDLLKATSKSANWPCVNGKKKAKKGSSYKNSGKLYLEYCKIVPEHSFLDYIKGGLQLCFSVGVDFTASNGFPENPNSLHYSESDKPNEYQRAITSIGNVIQDYDQEKKFIAMGFGAKIPPKAEVSYEFPLNFNHQNPSCEELPDLHEVGKITRENLKEGFHKSRGVKGIVEAYKNCLFRVQLNGPTIVAPIINKIISLAEKATEEQHIYYVLLIMTDGAITDMDATQEAIVKASELPMSIIIIGIGNGDFGGLTHLDSDNSLLTSTTGICVRDIVQFVPFRKYQNASSTILAKEVLAEIPWQVTEYYKLKKISPKPDCIPTEEQQI